MMRLAARASCYIGWSSTSSSFEESFSQSSKGSSPLKASQHAYGLDKAKREELIASALGLKKINTDDDTDDNSGGMYILSVVYHNLVCYRCSRYINIVTLCVFRKKRKSWPHGQRLCIQPLSPSIFTSSITAVLFSTFCISFTKKDGCYAVFTGEPVRHR